MAWKFTDRLEMGFQVIGDGQLAGVEHQHVGDAAQGQGQGDLLYSFHRRLRTATLVTSDLGDEDASGGRSGAEQIAGDADQFILR